MFGAGTCYSASADLAAIGDVLAKKVDVFVVDVSCLIATERAWLLLKLLHCCCRHLAYFWLWLQRLIISCAHCGAPF